VSAIALSDRQLDYLRELVAGKSSKEIAATLQVAESTVETMLSKLYGLLGVRRRSEAVRVAIERGLVPLSAARPGVGARQPER
jgi:DNA-binding NarL/FixJ family response regulator